MCEWCIYVQMYASVYMEVMWQLLWAGFLTTGFEGRTNFVRLQAQVLLVMELHYQPKNTSGSTKYQVI